TRKTEGPLQREMFHALAIQPGPVSGLKASIARGHSPARPCGWIGGWIEVSRAPARGFCGSGHHWVVHIVGECGLFSFLHRLRRPSDWARLEGAENHATGHVAQSFGLRSPHIVAVKMALRALAGEQGFPSGTCSFVAFTGAPQNVS